MPQRAATIESLPMAFEVVKQMQADGPERGEGYRLLGRRALATVYPGIPLQRCCLTRTRSGGPQDQGRPRQGPQGRPRRRHERRRPPRGAQRRAALRRRLGADLSQGRRLPAQRSFGRLRTGSRRTAHMLPVRIPCRAQASQNDQRHRTALPESPATDT